jgi:L-iditol 2-dehydrogenase
MRAAVYYSNRDVRVEERPAPAAGPGELVFRVMASGVCGSDVMEWYRLAKAPVVLGHEVAGEVVEIGRGLAGFATGDRIVTTHHVPCNECRYCRSGQHPVCDTLRRTSFDPGGFAELVRLPAANVARGTFALPDHVTYDEASFVEPLACVARGQRVAGGVVGKTVAVLGSGIAGLLHILWAKAHGAARIVATDIHPFRLDAARRAGASVTIDACHEDVPALIQEANGCRAADLVIVCTASLAAVGHALKAVDRGGTILFFALFPPGATVPFPISELGRDGITIVHSYAGPPADMRSALDAIAARRVDVASLITHRLPLAATGEAFRLVEEAGESLKVIIAPQE